MKSIIALLIRSIDSGQLAGWTRAGVAAGLAAAVAKWGVLAPFVTEEFSTAAAVVATTVVVGVWSTVAKKLS
jgi:hypothetical protein